MKRVIAWVRRFVHNCLYKDKHKGCLSCEEMKQAEFMIIKAVQRDILQDEYQILAADKVLPKGNRLLPLSPFIDSFGCLRVGGRLLNAPISEDSKHPLILPRTHHVTNLIIEYAHKNSGHVGVEHVLAQLRNNYWIMGARIAIKSVLRRCFPCKVRRARRTYPLMANLPRGRVAYSEPPFSNCGTDALGPLYVKQGRKRLKRWVILYTCLTIRCVHLDVLENMDTDAFINSFRRFVNRRGCPATVYSDNGTNFIGASKELKEVVSNIDRKKVTDFATALNIAWNFNPPAPLIWVGLGKGSFVP